MISNFKKDIPQGNNAMGNKIERTYYKLDSSNSKIYFEILKPEEPDYNKAIPKCDEKALYGLLGNIAKESTEKSEANPFAVMANLIVMLGSIFGRKAFIKIDVDKHYPIFFILHVGKASKGKKGLATSIAKTLFDKLEEEITFLPKRVSGGLSTGEGIVNLIHDGIKNNDPKKKEEWELPPIDDKRLWVVESEFNNIFTQSQRSGNSLIDTLRTLWDGIELAPLTKTNKIGVRNPHINIMGHITPYELRNNLTSNNSANGLASRFMIFYADRSKSVQIPKSNTESFNKYKHKLVEIINYVEASDFTKYDQIEVTMNEEANSLYKTYYDEIDGQEYSEKLDPMLGRRLATLQRLAMLFALTDMTNIINANHIEAAKCWIDYWTSSIEYLFETGKQQEELEKTIQLSNCIKDYLKDNGQATRTQISTDVFKKNLSKDYLDKALNFLLGTSPPTVELIKTVINDSKKPSKIYKYIG
ncbi:DUF3987 domain-containing protein [Taylorella equigenitalis]|uniref:DUF3987 domain-containing protein n=1 Tax=Taylorella equigenitalis TaxID=29575 RepID=UPI00237C5D2F|nr:DUF3987 domain-containing protein [Taylorella equigenitalis]WDU48701.1 DUF3987 domain-containing protein [Taylorella equigenitalis]WDU51177.1 DUF3987 domain-containing protein [Taylorella equigenitalis]